MSSLTLTPALQCLLSKVKLSRPVVIKIYPERFDRQVAIFFLIIHNRLSSRILQQPIVSYCCYFYIFSAFIIGCFVSMEKRSSSDLVPRILIVFIYEVIPLAAVLQAS